MTLNQMDAYSDEELIVMLRDGEHRATDYLMDKYKDMVRHKARSMYILGADREDLIQEGMIGLYKAIRDFDAGRDACFATFATLCVSRQIYTAVQAGNRQKHQPLNSYVSIDGDDDSEGGNEELVADHSTNPEAIVLGAENYENIRNLIETELSPLEKQIFELYLTGMGYVEIAQVLGRDPKSTDNALQRAKMKLKKKLDSDY